ncbi:hypothetical protein [Actinoplanes auranticolor]|uniref:LPXTG-motif cell wall-anchored protein n=1 Tax=Actinoplanes auranticolor TaxID=47988 RepID=A0A919SMY3_9ACTN|nr:hypothetical protein [Actinoplanes auranticolor]GIM74684.1 hypothetical protein Aau02nite_62180 [Actinoplanes auranticolor]
MLKNLLPRAAAITAGALLGLTTLMAAAPSQAAVLPAAVSQTAVSPGDAAQAAVPPRVDGPSAQTGITGAAACNAAAGEWTITWTITNNWTEMAKVDKLSTVPAPVPGLADGGYLNRRQESGTVGKTIFTQVLRNSPAEASVSFVAVWAKTKDADNKATVQLGACEQPEPPCVQQAQARFHHEFAVKDGQATATVTLDDDVKLCAAEPVTLVTYFAPKPQFSVPQYVFAHRTATISNEQRAVTLTAPLPACNTQADLFFGGEGDIIGEITEDGERYGDLKLGSGNGPGSRSEGPQGWYNGGSRGCHQPAVQPVSQCDGAVDVNLSNTGEQTKYPVDFTVRAGEFTQTVTVAPGKGETVRVPAGRGLITVTADGMKDVTYEWQRPENCPPPGDGGGPGGGDPGEGGGPGNGDGDGGGSNGGGETDGGGSGAGGGDDDGGLPVTGAAAGTIAAGAAVLLIGGGVLFVVARRRRVTFTP